ncbi:MAG: gliding motility-associated C-terminal domain-containing protein [Taibaiella sp.]|nr:gliding motility-associated C-terminal domain-containing protein [Taibaiella sp.]
MRKYLLLILLSTFSQLQVGTAQTLFTSPDTVCVRQPVQLNSTNLSATNYYWGFCSGNIFNAPGGTNMGSSFGFHDPANIDITRDKDGLYYGFVVNSSTREFLRLNYGTSLDNVPTVTNFGSLTDGLPVHPTSLYIVYDTTAKNWFVFVTGGYDASESTVGRIDFGRSLNNPRPNVANFGNMGGNFNGPKGIFVAKDTNGLWYGYLVNRYSNDLIRLDFSYNVSITPITTNLGNVAGVLNAPSDMAAIKDNGNWYLFVTNRASSTVVRIDLGPVLDNLTPTALNLGDFNFRILEPSSISINRDCGKLFAYVTDSTTSQLIAIEMPVATGPYNSIDYAVVGGMNYPSGISSIIRDQDNLYAFITNTRDSSLTKLKISQCTNSSIPSFSEVTPPIYYYNDTGVFNIYYVIDQGLPTMQVECKEITVLPIPSIAINPLSTICKGDTIKLYAISNTADSFVWLSDYNIDTAYRNTDTLKAWPAYTTDYHLIIGYPDGCIVDTNLHVDVIKVLADAGPDRTIGDGASTTLGGPNMSLGGAFTYQWTPSTYLEETRYPFPVANVPNDFVYVVEVTTQVFSLTCTARDSVVVHVNCGDFYLPNAFNPGSLNAGVNKFGIINKQIAQLNYFRIFNRWGSVVFETTDPTQQWDGTFNGKDAPVGVYAWIADGFCQSGKAIKKQGNVTLVR